MTDSITLYIRVVSSLLTSGCKSERFLSCTVNAWRDNALKDILGKNTSGFIRLSMLWNVLPLHAKYV